MKQHIMSYAHIDAAPVWKTSPSTLGVPGYVVAPEDVILGTDFGTDAVVIDAYVSTFAGVYAYFTVLERFGGVVRFMFYIVSGPDPLKQVQRTFTDMLERAKQWVSTVLQGTIPLSLEFHALLRHVETLIKNDAMIFGI